MSQESVARQARIFLPDIFDFLTAFTGNNTEIKKHIKAVDPWILNQYFPAYRLPDNNYLVSAEFISVDSCDSTKMLEQFAGSKMLSALFPFMPRCMYMLLHKHEPILEDAIGKHILFPAAKGFGMGHHEAIIDLEPISQEEPLWKLGKQLVSMPLKKNSVTLRLQLLTQ